MNHDIKSQIDEYFKYLREWDSVYETYARSVGLSYTGLLVLCAIHETDNCTQKILCDRCMLPKQTVNAIVTAFYKKGWVRLEELAHDRRTKVIRFTDDGAKQADEIIENIRQCEFKAMLELTDREREALLSATRRCSACFKKATLDISRKND